MKLKPATLGLPAALLVLSGAARADLTPFSFGASETIEHESNVYHSPSAKETWLSSTSLQAAIDENIGRQKLLANGQVAYNRYTNDVPSNTSYTLGTELDWNTIGDLSGTLGANTARQRYLYGLNGEVASGSTNNLQTSNHYYAHAQLGGLARWTLFGGGDINQRHYSDPTFNVNKEEQWSMNGGTRYQTSPDLSFGLVGSYTHGKYPNLPTGPSAFSLRSIDFTTNWQASGNSALSLRTGYTRERDDGRPDRKYWNGDIGWQWSPPSHFKVSADLSRDSDADTAASSGAVLGSSNLSGRSVNTTLRTGVTYEFSPKTNLVGGFQYAKRRYASGTLPVSITSPIPITTASGSNRTTQLSLTAHYLPTLNSDVSCGFVHEVRHADESIAPVTPAYTANNILCSAEIQFR